MRRRFLRAHPVLDILVGIGVGIEMKECRLAAVGQLAPLARDRLDDAAGDAVIAADRDGIDAGIGDLAEEGGDALDAFLVVHRLGQGHVADIADARGLPGREIEMLVIAPVMRRDMAHGARPQMLVALGRAIAGTVRHADQGNVAILEIGRIGCAEERRHAPPIERLHHHPVGGVIAHAP